MTAPGPIPIQPVNIRPELAPTPPSFVEQFGTGFQVIALALQKRQELEAAKQKLTLDREKFELQKKLTGTEIAGMELEHEKMKRAFKAQDEDLVAQDEALRIFTGNLPTAHDPQAWGQVFANVKDPRVGAHLMTLIQGMTELRGKGATAESTELGNRKTIFGINQDQLTRSILQRYGPRLTTERGQQQAIAEIAANAGPEAANSVASAFNVGAGRYHNWAGPNGYMYIIDTKNGRVRQGEFVGTKAVGAANQEAVRRGAATIVELLDEQSRIAEKDIKGTQNPTLAEIAATSRVLGVSTEALANLWRTNPQQVTQLLKTRFAHNYVGLLPHSRSAANLLRNLTESYWAPPNSSISTLQRAEADRKILRAIMHDVATGKVTDWTRIPGFGAAAAAASEEAGQAPPTDPNAPPANPMDWQQGVPPP